MTEYQMISALYGHFEECRASAIEKHKRFKKSKHRQKAAEYWLGMAQAFANARTVTYGNMKLMQERRVASQVTIPNKDNE